MVMDYAVELICSLNHLDIPFMYLFISLYVCVTRERDREMSSFSSYNIDCCLAD